MNRSEAIEPAAVLLPSFDWTHPGTPAISTLVTMANVVESETKHRPSTVLMSNEVFRRLVASYETTNYLRQRFGLHQFDAPTPDMVRTMSVLKEEICKMIGAEKFIVSSLPLAASRCGKQFSFDVGGGHCVQMA